LLTDVLKPNVDGLVLAERLSQERLGTRVVYMSGYVEGCILVAKYPKQLFLQKPFTGEALLATVRKALGSE
jgi:two-component system cell cycle sensor histidine kinase/response regulator CckA